MSGRFAVPRIGYGIIGIGVSLSFATGCTTGITGATGTLTVTETVTTNDVVASGATSDAGQSDLSASLAELGRFVDQNDALIGNALVNFVPIAGGTDAGRVVVERANVIRAQVAAGRPDDEVGLRTLLAEQISVLMEMNGLLEGMDSMPIEDLLVTQEQPPPGPGVIAVPNIVGFPDQQGANVLTDNGLIVVRGPALPSADIPAGHIMWQSVPEGGLIRRGDTITINISTGPR